MITTIACIGVGRMGGGIARNLARDGRFEVRVSDPSAEAVAACVEAGATAAASTAALLEHVDLVITSLPLPETVLAVHGAGRGLSPRGAIWMDVSTIDPVTARELADGARADGHRFVACPLGKGPAQAEAGELPLFVGGDPAAIEELADVFACIGEQVHVLGDVEAATSFKIVSNLIGMTNLAVLAEGYEICRSCGVDDETFTKSLRDTGGWSYQAQVRLPWIQDGDFANRFGVDLALKDLRLAVDMAARRGIPAPVGAAVLMQLVQAHAQGLGRKDANAVYRTVRVRDERR